MTEEFLKVQFQNIIEEADYWSRKPANEQTPYEHKYKARTILKELLEKNEILLQNQDLPEFKACKIIILTRMAHIYSDVEEGFAAEKFYHEAITLYSELPDEHAMHFLNNLQQIYNHLAITHINRDDNEVGMRLLGQAQELYSSLKELGISKIIVNTMDEYSEILNTGNATQRENVEFRFLYQGGLCDKQTDQHYMHTLFYLAQAFTKQGHKQLAAQYCGETLQRQYRSKHYVLKDWVVNCISLADFYMSLHNYSQAQYLLLAGLHVIPADRQKQLRATIEMSLGRMLSQYIQVCVQIQMNSLEEPNIETTFNRKVLIFESLNFDVPPLKKISEMEDFKSFFRQANTQYKRALQYFVLDGFVTENVQIMQDLSQMYKTLSLIETDKQRKFGMYEQRVQLLEPIFQELNPKAYQATWDTLLVELAEIKGGMFELKYVEYFQGKERSQKHLAQMNLLGEETVKQYQEISKVLLNDKDAERNEQYYQSYINAQLTIARTLGKLYRNDKQAAVDQLVKSLNLYKELVKFIQKEIRVQKQLDPFFYQEEKMCMEMIELLPNKIDQVNYSQF